ncbi:hypothetical protein B0H12DRAFT_1040311, partial [Mycena haematopus]
DYAYRLDLEDDPREWLDQKNQPLSMAAIIKSQDQDSWGGGSAGSTKEAKATKVLALDNVLCQVAKHECQGVYLCDQFDDSLLDGHERYEPNHDDMLELFKAERAVNIRETSSVALRAAAFYTEIHRKSCPHVDANGIQCRGLPINLDGKYGFIGCQNFRAEEARSHRFISIYRDVKEELLIELLSNDAENQIAYTHIDSNGQVVQGKIIHRKCNSTIRIFSPLDRSDHRAIVYLEGFHNHPIFPSTKLSRKGNDAYREAISTIGATGLTVVKCDSALSTQKIFDGKIPAAFDPALANPRIKRNLIKEAKMFSCPFGLGIEGVMHRQKQMLKLAHERQYIWRVTSEKGQDIVITMLPYLADRIHFAKASLHDNTYCRLHGLWKEWEIVVWDQGDNCRITMGRIYSQHETYDMFLKMWPGLFETIASVTNKEVMFKFIDGEGLHAILLDGNKPQANALGAYLLTRNRPHLSGVYELNPKLILPHILRTCIFHLERFVGLFVLVLYLYHWITDKDSAPWFFPSINRFLSKMPDDDWYLTPGDTNLNESAHPYTNQHTGTNLSLLEAIDSAYELDVQVEAKLRQIEQSGILMNRRNTKTHRDRSNAARRASHHRQAVERVEARTELEDIDDAIERSTTQTRELREQKKLLKSSTGVKKTKRKGEKVKETLPDADELAGLTETDSAQTPALSQPFLPPTLHISHEVLNVEVQLDRDLEPVFPTQYEESSLPLFSDISNYTL